MQENNYILADRQVRSQERAILDNVGRLCTLHLQKMLGVLLASQHYKLQKAINEAKFEVRRYVAKKLPHNWADFAHGNADEHALKARPARRDKCCVKGSR